MPSSESEEHLFISGDFAQLIWHHFEGPLGIISAASSVRQKLMNWWLVRGKNKYLCFMLQVIPILIVWEIWKARNNYFFEGKQTSPAISIDKILCDLTIIFKIQFPHFSPSLPNTWLNFASTLASDPAKFQITRTRWDFPKQQQLKLNTDGCSKAASGHGGGGGILRDFRGNLILAFASYFDSVNSLEAEIMALERGIRICRDHGFSNFIVETDSKILIDAIRQSKLISWRCRQELGWIFQSCNELSAIRHCYRESNQVADSLADHGFHSQRNITIHSIAELPQLARGFLLMDKSGIHSFRIRKG